MQTSQPISPLHVLHVPWSSTGAELAAVPLLPVSKLVPSCEELPAAVALGAAMC